MSQQLREPARELQLGSCKVVDAGFEVFAVCIDGPDNQFVPQHEIQEVLTSNTLHGLEVSKLWVHQVNPLPAIVEDYVLALKQEGLDYEYRQLGRAGFADTAQIAAGMPMWNTYDPMNNPLAGHEEEALPSAFTEALAQEMKMDQDEAVKRYRHAIGMARRIDFLFSMTFMSNACLTQDLFGKPAMMGDPTGSDHYGVLNTYTYQRKDCSPR